MGDVLVREATFDDAPGIARVHVQAWREAYARLLSAEYLSAIDETERTEKWRRILTENTSTVFVAECDSDIIGWASSPSDSDKDAAPGREVNGIYILASAYGSGVGQQLLDAIVGESAADLWIMEGNARAEGFYRRNGFVRTGDAFEREMGDRTVRIVRMYRDANPGRAPHHR